LRTTLQLKSGYWRVSAKSEDVQQCPVAALCRGSATASDAAKLGDGEGNGTLLDIYCTAGLTGPFCSQCSAGDRQYVDIRSASCKSCSSPRITLFLLLGGIFFLLLAFHPSGCGGHHLMHLDGSQERTAALGAMFFVLVRLCFSNRFTNRRPARQSTSEPLAPHNSVNSVGSAAAPAPPPPNLTLLQRFSLWLGVLQTRLFAALRVTWKESKVLMKQGVNFYQISTHVPVVYQIVLPPSYVGFLSALDVVNVRPTSLNLQYTCFGLNSFFRQLMFVMFVPVFIVVSVLVYYEVTGRRKNMRGGCQRALPFVVGFTFVTFSLVSSKAFQAFGCVCLDDGTGFGDVCYLRADVSLTCSVHGVRTSAYSSVQMLAALGVILYPVCVPLLYGWLLLNTSGLQRADAPSGSARKAVSRALDFLTRDYKQVRADAPSKYRAIVGHHTVGHHTVGRIDVVRVGDATAVHMSLVVVHVAVADGQTVIIADAAAAAGHVREDAA
jgi:hypothetical protein